MFSLSTKYERPDLGDGDGYDMDPMPASVHEEMPELPAVIDA